VHLLAAEVERPGPGSDDVVSRLVDVLLVYILRSWQALDATACPGWFGALADPLVGSALGLVHDDPAGGGPSPPSPRRSVSPARRSRGASRRWSVSRRWRTSPAGG
jgi:hypothetical protein